MWFLPPPTFFLFFCNSRRCFNFASVIFIVISYKFGKFGSRNIWGFSMEWLDEWPGLCLFHLDHVFSLKILHFVGVFHHKQVKACTHRYSWSCKTFYHRLKPYFKKRMPVNLASPFFNPGLGNQWFCIVFEKLML